MRPLRRNVIPCVLVWIASTSAQALETPPGSLEDTARAAGAHAREELSKVEAELHESHPESTWKFPNVDIENTVISGIKAIYFGISGGRPNETEPQSAPEDSVHNTPTNFSESWHQFSTLVSKASEKLTLAPENPEQWCQPSAEMREKLEDPDPKMDLDQVIKCETRSLKNRFNEIYFKTVQDSLEYGIQRILDTTEYESYQLGRTIAVAGLAYSRGTVIAALAAGALKAAESYTRDFAQNKATLMNHALAKWFSRRLIHSVNLAGIPLTEEEIYQPYVRMKQEAISLNDEQDTPDSIELDWELWTATNIATPTHYLDASTAGYYSKVVGATHRIIFPIQQVGAGLYGKAKAWMKNYNTTQ